MHPPTHTPSRTHVCVHTHTHTHQLKNMLIAAIGHACNITWLLHVIIVQVPYGQHLNVLQLNETPDALCMCHVHNTASTACHL